MPFKDKWDLVLSERIRRIGQRDDVNFKGPPPSDFLSSVLASAEEWNASRASRHLPNGLIYHYCDANALLNILRSRTVWATSTKYLNDTTELLTLTTSMAAHANRYRASAAGDVLADIVDFCSISADTRQTQTIGMDRFACCFSAEGDLLSQWRAYGNDGRGYAIGFLPHDLAGLSEPTPLMSLRRMAYGSEAEVGFIDEIFARFSPAVASHLEILDTTGSGRSSARNWLSMRFGECLFELVDEVKDPAFSEEQEWRLYGGGSQMVQFRVSQDRVVPSKQLDMSSAKEPTLMPIGEIVVGPKLDFAEATMSLMTYASHLGYGIGMDIRRSQAPYR